MSPTFGLSDWGDSIKLYLNSATSTTYVDTAVDSIINYLGTITTATDNTTTPYYLTAPAQWSISSLTPQPVTAPIDPAIRLSPPREFNKYINASDLLEEFIKWLGEQGVKQGEVMELPVELFIKWLIIKACEQDEEEPNVTLQLPAPKKQPHCLGCGQFMAKSAPLALHAGLCADNYFAKTGVERREKARVL